MEMIFMWAMLSVCCFVSSATQVYYITSNHSNCSVENETLKPCYTLSQLIMEDVLPSSKDRSIELVLLSGTHLISTAQSLRVSNFSEVKIHPLLKELEINIQCQPLFLLDGSFHFQDVVNLSLSFLRFTSCSFQHRYPKNSINRQISITNCAFERSRSNYAVSIENSISVVRGNSKLNVALYNCTFSSNHRGVMDVADIHQNGNAHLQITNVLFQNNGNGNKEGPSASTLQTWNTVVSINHSQFLNNTGYNIVNALGFILTMVNTVLQDNRAPKSNVFLKNSNVNITECRFVNNSGSTVIEISMYHVCGPPESIVSHTLFQGNVNTATNLNKGGAILNSGDAKMKIYNCNFKDNSAKYGGALYFENNNYECRIWNSNFTHNTAKRDGGAIYCDHSTVFLEYGKSSSFNMANGNGGFAYLSNSKLSIGSIFLTEENISNNKATNGGAVYALESSLCIDSDSIDSDSLRPPVITMGNNSASECGGALYLINSKIEVGVTLLFTHNSAANKGGAIFILDHDCENVFGNFNCFFTFLKRRKKWLINFANNTASEGPVLYGGLLDRCSVQYSNALPGIYQFKEISKYDPTPLAITSEPVRVCLCTDDLQVNCSAREITWHGVNKGQTIHLLGAVVDQDSNHVQSFIRASYSKLSAQLGKGESRRGTDYKCSNLSYHVYTTKNSATLMLRPEGECEKSNFSDIAIHVTVKPCLAGFENNDDRCGCDKRLAEFSITVCNIDTYSIQRQMPVWIRYDQEYLKVHANCPLDYCNATLDTISLEFSDEQCANHRSGVLCGACQDNYSIALGGSKCLQCTSNYTVIWLIPVFALAGIALVALLFVCNMTISHGTLNGLIFYANVVSITGLTSLQNCSIHPILSVFIAWVNLDLGVETCFYSGMDTYQKMWLQFAFPLYIWLLVGAIILASQRSMAIVKLFGRSSIAVLATLFLLSYSKILKTIIIALNFTEVFQGSANNMSDPLVPYNVWVYDGNLEYLKGKHVPLFAVAVVLLGALFLPYTLLLMFGQCLRSLPTKRRCVPRCIRSTAFISIMDAYHAPYNKKHRYWTGLLLLTRCVLYLAFATSYTDDQLLSNMYITTLIIMVILTLTMKVYKNFHKNLLEVCFLLNLGILSATLHYLESNSNRDGSICKCTSASISLSMALFGSVLLYHAYLQLKKTRHFVSFQGYFQEKWRAIKVPKEESAPIQRNPTSMFVQLREDLLESNQNDI